MGDTKSLPPEIRARLIAIVEKMLADAGYPKRSLRAIAPELGFEEPQLSSMRHGRGIGIKTLIKLRAVTKRSIDDLLGLDGERSLEDRITARVLAEIGKPAAPEPAPPKKAASRAGARR